MRRNRIDPQRRRWEETMRLIVLHLLLVRIWLWWNKVHRDRLLWSLGGGSHRKRRMRCLSEGWIGRVGRRQGKRAVCGIGNALDMLTMARVPGNDL